MTSVDQAQAILFGLALGDTLGYPLEFNSHEQARSTLKLGGRNWLPDPVLYSDDTQMTIALTEALLEAGLDADLDALMNAVGSWFVRWLHSPDNNRAPGNACLAGAKRFECGVQWRNSGAKDSKGCGSAMRVATIGYLYQNDERRLRDVAEASSLITHQHPAAIAASIAGAYLVKLALDGAPPETLLNRLTTFTQGISDDFDQALRRVGHVVGWGNEDDALHHIGKGWVGEEAIALALYCVLRYPDDYVGCVRRAVDLDGDRDSIACIAGGIIAARLGLDAIPADWISSCENRDYLRGLAARMALARDRHVP